MHQRIGFIWLTLFCFVRPLPAAVPASQERYEVVWRNGEVTRDKNLPNWNGHTEKPSFKGRRLFDINLHARLIRDTSRTAGLKPPYIVMINGDVIPGRIVRYSANEDVLSLPKHLVVELRDQMGSFEDQSVSVRLDRIRRIVGTLGGSKSRHKTGCTTRSGRHFRPRAVRWRETGITTLTGDKVESIDFPEIAQLWLPSGEDASLLMDDYCFPFPELNTLVCRMQTEQGAVLSFRRELLRGDSQPIAGGKRVAVQVIHPSWAIRPLYVARDSIIQRGYRRPMEYPVSQLPATTLGKNAGVHYLPWVRNRSVQGGILQCRDMFADFGIGTHSHSEVAFRLPERAAKFSCWVGINRGVADGGCATVKIYRDKVEGGPLWASGHLRGGQPPVAVGGLDVSGAKQLVLVTEFAHEGRPKDADPLDIRDHVDWLFPTIDALPSPEHNQLRLPRFLHGWNDWSIVGETDKTISFSLPSWQGHSRAWPITMRTGGKATMTLQQKKKISGENEVIVMRVSPVRSFPKDAIVLLADDKPIQPRVINRSNERTLIWNLAEWDGKEPLLKLAMQSGDQTGGLRWHGLGRGSTFDILPLLPVDDEAFKLWEQGKSRLGNPTLRRRVMRNVLDQADANTALRWCRMFFDTASLADQPDRIAELEGLIQETKIGTELLGRFQREIVPTHLRNWQVVGPFPIDARRRLQFKYPPERKQVDLTETFKGEKDDLAWLPYSNSADRVNLGEVLQTKKPGVAYAVCWAHVNHEQAVQLGVGSSDGISVRVNRSLVLHKVVTRNGQPRQDQVSAILQAGWNEILVKVDNVKSEWDFYLELREPERMQRPSGIRYSLTPDGR